MGAAPILTILKNGETIRSLPIEGEAVLGRSENCLIRLEDRAISRQHVAFKVTPSGVQIDRRSLFAPLIVNGKDCSRAILKEGDVVSLGPYILTLSSPPSVSATSSAIIEEEPAAPVALTPLEVPESIVEQPLAELPVENSDPVQALEMESVAQTGSDAALTGPGVLEAIQQPLQESPLESISQSAPALQTSSEPATNPLMEPFEHASADASTKIASAGKIAVRLVFQSGQANVQEFELGTAEVSIGRGQNCDIVLKDKKSSRKNCIIRRAGMSFVLKDLDSANGTFVNGVQVKEVELSGDDVIRIGDTEFRFVASSLEYDAQKDHLMPLEVTSAPEEGAASNFDLPDLALPLPEYSSPEAPMQPAAYGAPGSSVAWPSHNVGTGGIPGAGGGAAPAGLSGIVGVGAASAGGFLSRFTKRQRILAIIVAGVAFYLFTDPQGTTPKKAQNAAESKIPKVKTYETLSAKEKEFVEAKLREAGDFFKKADYDNVIAAAKQVLALIPNYDRAIEYENLALERKDALRRADEVRKAREEQERLKQRIADLVNEASIRMKNREYEQAREIFAEVLALDPDNSQVAEWRHQLEQMDEEQRMRQQEVQVRGEINKHAWGLYREALAVQKAGKHHVAIRMFSSIQATGATDRKLLALAKAGIARSREAVASRRDPLMAEARQLEDSGDFVRAYQLYREASEVDPSHKAAHAGMARLKGILHDKAKGVYTEAVLAESYSDFATAKQKFKECLDISPQDDVYFQRAKRKLANYLRLEESTQ